MSSLLEGGIRNLSARELHLESRDQSGGLKQRLTEPEVTAGLPRRLKRLGLVGIPPGKAEAQRHCHQSWGPGHCLWGFLEPCKAMGLSGRPGFSAKPQAARRTARLQPSRRRPSEVSEKAIEKILQAVSVTGVESFASRC